MRTIAPLLPAPARDLALEALHSVEARWADAEVRMGRIHGDWIPPNIRIGQDGRFNVYDWERSVTPAPLGVDSIQFILYLELLRRRPDLTIDGRLGRCGREALSRQGVDPNQVTLLALLSLLETILWFGEARQAGREQEHDVRFAGALAAILQQRRTPQQRRLECRPPN
jgi:hypothetical protein